LPVGYAQTGVTFRAIPADLEDAGRILGGGQLRVLRDVTAPLARSGVIAAWCFIFIGVNPRAVGLDHPVHAVDLGDVGRDLRPEGGRPIRGSPCGGGSDGGTGLSIEVDRVPEL